MRSNIENPPPRLVLASSSPRRRELLEQAGYAFDVVSPSVEEPREAAPGQTPTQHAEAVARLKARSAASRVLRGGTLPDEALGGSRRMVVLGTDTVVSYEGRIFGKPSGIEDARRILQALAGTTQEVITGLCLIELPGGSERAAHAVTRVTMRSMTPEELEDYLAGGDWQGKAGAYGIQDSGDAFIVGCEGSFSNVVGLPMELAGPMLAELGVWPRETRNRVAGET